MEADFPTGEKSLQGARPFPEGRLPQIKAALGVSGVLAQVYCWHCVADDAYPAGAQIDMLIERADHVINVTQFRTKLGVFEQVSKTRSAIHLTMVTSVGLLRNKHFGIVQSEVTLDDVPHGTRRRGLCH